MTLLTLAVTSLGQLPWKTLLGAAFLSRQHS